MGLDRKREQTQDTGRLGYRHDWEPVDERPLLVEYACQCKGCREHAGPWRDHSERLEYEHAVETNPIRPGEGPMAYAARISGIVEGRLRAAVASMPRPGMGPRKRDARLALLRGQAAGMPSGTEDYS